MTEKTIIIKDRSSSGRAKNTRWQPTRDGKIFNDYLNQKKGIGEKDKLTLVSDSFSLLSQCIDPEANDTIGKSTAGLCFGQIQSGKTTSMEAVTALAADNKFKIIILLTGNVTPLTTQNAVRLDNALLGNNWLVVKNYPKEPFDEYSTIESLKSAISTWQNPNLDDVFGKTILIITMKISPRIKKIIKLIKKVIHPNYSVLDKIPTLIIDDEADHYSLNAKTRKNDPESKDDNELYIVKENESWESIADKFDIDIDLLKEANPDETYTKNLIAGTKILTQYEEAATHKVIKKLRALFGYHSFLGYTATPDGNFLQPTINSLSPTFGQVLKAGNDYTGLEFFFGSQESINKYIRYIETKFDHIEDEERPESLEKAFLHYVISVTCGFINQDTAGKNRSMIIHPSRETEYHDQYKTWLKGMQLKWENDLKSDPNTEEYKEIYEKIKNNLEEIRVEANDKEKIPKLDNKFIDFFKTTLTSQIKIESFNAAKVDSHGKKTNKKSIPIIEYSRQYANILIGGQGLDRGYTVQGLTVTYLSRSLGTRQADTILQRARFFGYQKKNMDFIKIFMKHEVLDLYKTLYHKDKRQRADVKKHLENNLNLKDLPRVYVAPGITKLKLSSPARINSFKINNSSHPIAARDNFSHLLDKEDLTINKSIFENVKTQIKEFCNPLKDTKEINSKLGWTKTSNILLCKETTLKFVYDNILSKIQHEVTDLTSFRKVEQSIAEYLDLDDERTNKLLCPILFMPADKRTPSTRDVDFDKVTPAQGPNIKLKDNKNDTSLFPGDRNINYEYLIGKIKMADVPKNIPTLMMYELDILYTDEETKKDPEKIEIKYGKVPYFSFIPSEEIWSEMIIASEPHESS
jgi:hypothetical protein|tara:strand:- start:138 stop:2723 length:2586 start_codon:yes stop_codon:yes gene_type:complete